MLCSSVEIWKYEKMKSKTTQEGREDKWKDTSKAIHKNWKRRELKQPTQRRETEGENKRKEGNKRALWKLKITESCHCVCMVGIVACSEDAENV